MKTEYASNHGALDSTHDLNDSLDREIEAILAVEPSREFVSRVRNRIAGSPVPSGWGIGWAGLAAGSVAVAVFVAVATSKPPHEFIPQEAQGPASRSMQSSAPSDDLPALPHVNSTKAPAVRRTRISNPAFREPKMLINPEDAAATRRYLANPQPEPVELSFMTIEPQPLPEFTFTPLPIFDPMAVLQGDFK